MTPPEEAYRLAEDRIAEAKAGGWRYLNLSAVEGSDTRQGEERNGDPRLKNLSSIPASILDLTDLRALNLDGTQVIDLSIVAQLSNLQLLFADIEPLTDRGGRRISDQRLRWIA